VTEERRRVPVPDFSKSRGERPASPQGNGGQPTPAAPVECNCPRLDPADWDGIESDWSDIAFLKTSVSALMGVPIGYGTARHGLEARAKKAGATIPNDAMVLLGGGRMSRKLLLEVEDVPDSLKVTRPGGVAFTRLLEVPWGKMKEAVQNTTTEAKAKYGRKPDGLWVWYLTCRECSAARRFETLIVAHYKARA